MKHVSSLVLIAFALVLGSCGVAPTSSLEDARVSTSSQYDNLPIADALKKAGKTLLVGPALEAALDNPSTTSKIKVEMMYSSPVEEQRTEADHQADLKVLKKSKGVKVSGQNFFGAIGISYYVIEGSSKDVRAMLLTTPIRLTETHLAGEVTFEPM
jgi:hypothetical protein